MPKINPPKAPPIHDKVTATTTAERLTEKAFAISNRTNVMEYMQ
ncbi:MAG: hypothetical protein TQ35_0008715 [Candidatus Aramenus sulfurataquae]|uniref:Uncharacterized protein n=1 Tax=Candidatus Aramenus sulfurataquae TaxID=1326980 RepID=A0ACC6TQT6_9CREN